MSPVVTLLTVAFTVWFAIMLALALVGFLVHAICNHIERTAARIYLDTHTDKEH